MKSVLTVEHDSFEELATVLGNFSEAVKEGTLFHKDVSTRLELMRDGKSLALLHANYTEVSDEDTED